MSNNVHGTTECDGKNPLLQEVRTMSSKEKVLSVYPDAIPVPSRAGLGWNIRTRDGVNLGFSFEGPQAWDDAAKRIDQCQSKKMENSDQFVHEPKMVSTECDGKNPLQEVRPMANRESSKECKHHVQYPHECGVCLYARDDRSEWMFCAECLTCRWKIFRDGEWMCVVCDPRCRDMPKLPAVRPMSSRDKVLTVHKSAYESWTCEVFDRQGLPNKRLGSNWDDAASKLPASTEDAAPTELSYLPPLGDRRYHFEDKQVIDAIVGTEYLKINVQGRLNFMTSGEKWSLYRAIVNLAQPSTPSPEVPTPEMGEPSPDSQRAAIYTAEQVCRLIDAFPNVNQDIARAMKASVRNGQCPSAVRQSLNLAPIVCFQKVGSPIPIGTCFYCLGPDHPSGTICSKHPDLIQNAPTAQQSTSVLPERGDGLPLLERRLADALYKFRYESSMGRGQRGLMTHHVSALTSYLVGFIYAELERLSPKASDDSLVQRLAAVYRTLAQLEADKDAHIESLQAQIKRLSPKEGAKKEGVNG